MSASGAAAIGANCPAVSIRLVAAPSEWPRPGYSVRAYAVVVEERVDRDPVGLRGVDEVVGPPAVGLRQRLLERGGAIEACTLSPDGRLALTGETDRGARLWSTADGALLHELLGHTLTVQAVAFFDGGRRAITGSSDGTARVWDTATGACFLTLTGHTTQVFGVAASPDGRLIATGSVDQTTRVWDVGDGRTTVTIPSGAACVAFTPDGAGLITGAWSGWIGRWRLSNGALVREYRGHVQGVWDVRCYDGRLLSASADGTARLWDLETGDELRPVGDGSGMTSAELTPDGAQIGSGHADGSVRVWDADINATVAEVAARLRRDFYDHERAMYGVGEPPAG